MPVRYIKTLANGSSLCLWYIEESEKELHSNLTISSREQKELSGIRSERGRIRWLAVRQALNALFPHGVAECLKDEHGKPYIANYNGYISLSHSNDFAIAMVHPENAVGVDIEIIQPKIRRIAGKFLKDSEIARIHGEHEIERLYVCWCAKEAIFKWQGKKGISLKQNIEIEAFHFQETGTLRARLYTPDFSQHLMVDYEKMDGYLLAYLCNA